MKLRLLAFRNLLHHAVVFLAFVVTYCMCWAFAALCVLIVPADQWLGMKSGGWVMEVLLHPVKIFKSDDSTN